MFYSFSFLYFILFFHSHFLCLSVIANETALDD